MVLRTLVGSRGLPSNSTCVLDVAPGQFDAKRCDPGFTKLNTIMANYRVPCRFKAIDDVIQKCNVMLT